MVCSRRFALAALLAALAPSTVVAAPSVPPPPAGWASPQTPTSQSRLPGGPIVYSSPLVAELDRNPDDGKEIVVAASDGTVAAYHASGKILWSNETPNASCGSANDRVYSSPAVGDLFGNGTLYVVLGYGGFAQGPCDGGVVAYFADTGAKAWSFSLRAFGRAQHFGSNHFAVYSTPALADTDFDGRMEIGFGALDRNVYLLNANGKVRWFYNAADTVFSSAAFANVDGDRNLEMIIGTDISANPHIRPPTRDGGYMYAFKTARRHPSLLRLYFQARGTYLWRRWFNQVMQSSPVIADVLPRHPGKEIVVGSGCYFPTRSSNKTGRWVKILDLHGGRMLRTLRSPGCFSSSPAVADIDGDGHPEIIATVNGSRGLGGDGYSRVVAWKPDRREPFWETTPLLLGNDNYGGTLQSPVVADLDGNGSLEVVVSNGSGVVILEGKDGRQLTCPDQSCDASKLILRTGTVMKGTPAIADINNDGNLEVVVGSGASGNGAVYSWSHFAGILKSTPGTNAPYSAPWPMFRGGASRDGSP